MADLILQDERSDVVRDLATVVFNLSTSIVLVRMPLASTPRIEICSMLALGPNAPGPVVCGLPQCFDLSARSCHDVKCATLELVGGCYLHTYNIFVAVLLDCTLDVSNNP